MSLAAINANSPYEVKVALADDTLCFITDYDAEIFVTFERDDILHNGLVYQFGISNPKGVKSPRDPKVRETILAIVEEFFAKNNAAFLYICDTSGGMQKIDSYWFGSGTPTYLINMMRNFNVYADQTNHETEYRPGYCIVH